jgi:DNA topoisomerase VI subunit B
MRKPKQIPREPRRKLQHPDRYKHNEIRELLQESEERVRRFLEEFHAERSSSDRQGHQRKR